MKRYSEQILKIVLPAAARSNISESVRCMSSQSTHLLTTIISSFGTFFHPLDPLKTAACSNGELFYVFLKIGA